MSGVSLTWQTIVNASMHNFYLLVSFKFQDIQSASKFINPGRFSAVIALLQDKR